MAGRRLVKYGPDLALVIDRELLDALGIGESTPLDVRAEDGKIIVSPLDESEDKEELRRILEDICDKYGNALRRLAD